MSGKNVIKRPVGRPPKQRTDEKTGSKNESILGFVTIGSDVKSKVMHSPLQNNCKDYRNREKSDARSENISAGSDQIDGDLIEFGEDSVDGEQLHLREGTEAASEGEEGAADGENSNVIDGIEDFEVVERIIHINERQVELESQNEILKNSISRLIEKVYDLEERYDKLKADNDTERTSWQIEKNMLVERIQKLEVASKVKNKAEKSKADKKRCAHDRGHEETTVGSPGMSSSPDKSKVPDNERINNFLRKERGRQSNTPEAISAEHLRYEIKERKDRRKNIVVKCSDKEVQMSAEEMLKFVGQALEVERGNLKVKFARPNLVCCECISLELKKQIIAKKRSLKGSSLWIEDDHTRREIQIQKWIRQVVRNERSKGNSASVGYLKIVINGVVRKFNEVTCEFDMMPFRERESFN